MCVNILERYPKHIFGGYTVISIQTSNPKVNYTFQVMFTKRFPEKI